MLVPFGARRIRRAHVSVLALAALTILSVPAASQAADTGPVVVEPVATTPVAALPTITNVTPPALFARVGYLLRVRGARLTGTKYVTIGVRKVRPFIAFPSEVWLIAPGLNAGTYPVSVTTAAGTSVAADAAVLSYY